jgi:Flp pilus assembly protein TadG
MQRSPAALLRRFVRDERGAALIELGFAVPILVAILLGCFETTRYVLLHQKMSRAAASTADLVAQLDGITVAQMNDLFDAADQLMEPFDFAADGRIIVSSVYRPGVPAATVVWQRLNTAGIAATSAIGATGATASLPPGLVVDAGENVIVAEVVYDYEPFFFDAIFDPVRLTHDAFNRPRVANLTQITP